MIMNGGSGGSPSLLAVFETKMLSNLFAGLTKGNMRNSSYDKSITEGDPTDVPPAIFIPPS